MKSGNVKSGRTGNITIDEALEVLRKQYNCWITTPHECPIQCEKCENDVDFADLLEASKTVLDSFGNHSELPNSSDLVSRSYLLAEYDRQHVGPPGGARKIIAEAPSIFPTQMSGTSEDTISRQAAIDGFDKLNMIDTYETDGDVYLKVRAQDVVDMLKQLPSAQPKQET